MVAIVTKAVDPFLPPRSNFHSYHRFSQCRKAPSDLPLYRPDFIKELPIKFQKSTWFLSERKALDG